MIIKTIEQGSIAKEIGLKAGDKIITINEQIIHDIIDYRFHISDEFVELEITRADETFIFDIEKEPDEDLGLEFESLKYRCCGNKCVFCFVDQNPPGLRANLYFKDEDFRLSFLHGNYVTLTNISRKELARIAEQRLSPLYISVHATEIEVRKLLLGIRQDDRLLEKVKFLADHEIELHVQIVLCPGINDGQHLITTINDLAVFYPQIRSIAIVPVGLTKYRDRLYPLDPVTPKVASHVIAKIESLARVFHQNNNTYFIYLADEFYLLAKQKIPFAERYEGFYQYENGVGMLRYFIDQFAEQAKQLPAKIDHAKKIRIVTAELASDFLKTTVVPELNKIENLNVQLSVINNNFYGARVKVSGLMTGSDIFDQLTREEKVDHIVLPQNCLNTDGYFLDDWTVPQLEQKLSQNILISGLDLNTLIEKIQ